MLVLDHKKELGELLLSWRQSGLSIGFVPTMGALHRGHISLVKACMRENDRTVVSIYVNPTQFNNQRDLEKYPKSLQKDIESLEELADVLFTPSDTEMYGDDVKSLNFDFRGLDQTMEGAHRPGHFEGMATIVSKLFEAVGPDRAYFGLKDYQQFLIVRQIAKQMNVEIIGSPIVREPNGLAMSSRNERLSQKDRKEAAIIHNALVEMRIGWPISSIDDLKTRFIHRVENGSQGRVEYIEIAESESLKTHPEARNYKSPRAFCAVDFNGVRLIDNHSLID